MDDHQLIEAAAAARRQAYAPYSRFAVGAALLDRDGRVHLGVNVENASLGLSVCAERVAIGRAIADGVRDFVAIAVVTDAQELTPPCGACRQVLLEFAPDLRVLLASPRAGHAEHRLSQLMAHPFRDFRTGQKG